MFTHVQVHTHLQLYVYMYVYMCGLRVFVCKRGLIHKYIIYKYTYCTYIILLCTICTHIHTT
jgi:hypothetical protein